LRRIEKLAAALGIDKGDVIELAIRDLARKEGIEDDPDPDPRPPSPEPERAMEGNDAN